MKYSLKTNGLVGFANENTEAGQKGVWIKVKEPFLTSNTDLFHVYQNGIIPIFFPQDKILTPDAINAYIIILHSNNNADVYINEDCKFALEVKVNKSIQAGELVYKNNIDDIRRLVIQDIKINKDDKIIVCIREGWRFALYFDFSENIDTNKLFEELGTLKRKLFFENFADKVKSTKSSANKILAENEDIEAVIYTEGKTDIAHIQKADQILDIKNLFLFDEEKNPTGDSEALGMCKYFGRSPTQNKKKIIFIFDRDNPYIIKQVEKKSVVGKDFQSWGNNVFSFLLPVPSHRVEYKNINIEMYYKDTELKTKDSNGKSLVFSNELKNDNSVSPPKRILTDQNITKEFEKKVESGDVSLIIDETGNQVAISKAKFAEYISQNANGFENFDYSEFGKIFAVIKEIIEYKD